MKNILIPTDFSENSHNAIRYALDYFEDIPANFFILHVSHKNHSLKNEISESFFDLSDNTQLVHNPSLLLKEEIKACQRLTRNIGHKFYPLQEDLVLV